MVVASALKDTGVPQQTNKLTNVNLQYVTYSVIDNRN